MMITVLMSVYNSEEYLRAAIDSVLSQTYKDFEFLIIDDGSTDASVEIIRDYASKDSRIVFVQNDGNLGLGASLNRGILLAKGKYIARQDADDLSAPERLELQINYAIANPEVDVIGSNSFVIDIAGKVVYTASSFSSCTDLYTKLLSRQAAFPHGSAFMKKEKLIQDGLYDTRFYFIQDGELWLRMLKKGANFHVLGNLLYYYRLTPISNPKRKQTKDRFNSVLQMLYKDSVGLEAINMELEDIVNNLRNSPKGYDPFHLSHYWKSLANASYFNSNEKLKTYSYLRKAFNSKNSLHNYLNYSFLTVMYLLPKSFTRSLLKFSN